MPHIILEPGWRGFGFRAGITLSELRVGFASIAWGPGGIIAKHRVLERKLGDVLLALDERDSRIARGK